jgi:hypothetical protein
VCILVSSDTLLGGGAPEALGRWSPGPTFPVDEMPRDEMPRDEMPRDNR